MSIGQFRSYTLSVYLIWKTFSRPRFGIFFALLRCATSLGEAAVAIAMAEEARWAAWLQERRTETTCRDICYRFWFRIFPPTRPECGTFGTYVLSVSYWGVWTRFGSAVQRLLYRVMLGRGSRRRFMRRSLFPHAINIHTLD